MLSIFSFRGGEAQAHAVVAGQYQPAVNNFSLPACGITPGARHRCIGRHRAGSKENWAGLKDIPANKRLKETGSDTSPRQIQTTPQRIVNRRGD